MRATDDRAERDYPQRRDLLGADSPSEDEVLEDRDAEREQAGQLRQLRHIVERGVHKPEIVAVVEAGELEHEQDQSRSDHSRERRAALIEGAQDKAGGQRGRRDVGDTQETAMQRFPPTAAPTEPGRSTAADASSSAEADARDRGCQPARALERPRPAIGPHELSGWLQLPVSSPSRRNADSLMPTFL